MQIFSQFSPEVGAAIVAGAVSLLVSLVTLIWDPINQRRVEKLRSQFEDWVREKDARRDYVYEARKRLYTEVEPLLFQLFEATDGAYHRICSLARTSRNGSLGGKENWLSNSAYYLHSTAYLLILPAVIYRLIQRRMTFIDMSVEAGINLKYQALKLYYRSFTDHFDFARCDPELTYDPKEEPGVHEPTDQSAVRRYQGFVLGDLDSILDALIVGSEDKGRPCTFGEFSEIMSREKSPEYLVILVATFQHFSFGTRPVLGRMLMAQACLCKTLLRTFEPDVTTVKLRNDIKELFSKREFADALSWRRDWDGAELKAVQPYVIGRLGNLSEHDHGISGPSGRTPAPQVVEAAALV